MIVDVDVPEANGLAVCARLLDPRRRSLNLIVVAGNQQQETFERREIFGVHFVRRGNHRWYGLASVLSDTFPHLRLLGEKEKA